MHTKDYALSATIKQTNKNKPLNTYNKQKKQENNNKKSVSRIKVFNSETSFYEKKLFLTASFGVLNATENLFLHGTLHPGGLNSQLDWEHKKITFMTLGFDYKPHNRFSIGFRGIFTIGNKKNNFFRMDDYDWMNPNIPNPSEHSAHPYGKFKYTDIDVYLKFRFFEFGDINKYGQLNFYLMAGFRYVDIDALALGGVAYYSQGTGLIDSLEEHGLRERHRLYLPYLAIAFRYQYKQFDALLTFKNSFATTARFNDEHRIRQVFVDNSHKNFYNYQLSFDIGYLVNNYLRIFFITTINQTLRNYNISSKWTENGQTKTNLKGYFEIQNFSYSFSIGATLGLF